jgi:membrane associated rhomboid family serine protease
MSDLSSSLRSGFRVSDAVQRLLIINIVVFVIVRVLGGISALFMSTSINFPVISYWLAVPANLSSLLVRPWTIISYMFYHWEFFHLFFNLLLLYWMGKIFQAYLGEKKLISTYIIGGICGAVFYIVAYNIFPLFSNSMQVSFALGASASVLAITIAAATLLPDFPVRLLLIGEVKLKWLALVIVISDLISISGTNAGGHLAHLGGAFYGFIYIRQLRSGNDLAAWFDRLIGYFSREKKTRMKVEYRKSSSDADYNYTKHSRQERLDIILDKISKSGYGSLSQEEKDELFKASKDN